MAQIKNRIKELKQVKISDIKANPKNWRTHPVSQQNAMRGILEEIGYADALMVRETPEGYMLIDGHLRTAISDPDEIVPVLVVDLSEDEADLLLATFDPIGEMAGRDEMKITELLESLNSDNLQVSELLMSLNNNFELPETEQDQWNEHWKEMPEFEQDDLTPFRTFLVHFRNAEDVKHFAKILGQEFTDITKSIWHPKLIQNVYKDKEYVSSPEIVDLQ
jgi:hypothetical protein